MRSFRTIRIHVLSYTIHPKRWHLHQPTAGSIRGHCFSSRWSWSSVGFSLSDIHQLVCSQRLAPELLPGTFIFVNLQQEWCIYLLILPNERQGIPVSLPHKKPFVLMGQWQTAKILSDPHPPEDQGEASLKIEALAAWNGSRQMEKVFISWRGRQYKQKFFCKTCNLFPPISKL